MTKIELIRQNKKLAKKLTKAQKIMFVVQQNCLHSPACGVQEFQNCTCGYSKLLKQIRATF